VVVHVPATFPPQMRNGAVGNIDRDWPARERSSPSASSLSETASPASMIPLVKTGPPAPLSLSSL
jgi:hypothetical protein